MKPSTIQTKPTTTLTALKKQEENNRPQKSKVQQAPRQHI